MVLLGADVKAGSREAVVPGQSLLFSLAAEHSVFVLLRRDVLLPLPLAVTMPTTQTAVQASLKHREEEPSSCETLNTWTFFFFGGNARKSNVNPPLAQRSQSAWRCIFPLMWTEWTRLRLLGGCWQLMTATCRTSVACRALQVQRHRSVVTLRMFSGKQTTNQGPEEWSGTMLFKWDKKLYSYTRFQHTFTYFTVNMKN